MLEHNFLSDGVGLVKEAASLTRKIANVAVLEEMKGMGVEAGGLNAEVTHARTHVRSHARTRARAHTHI